jgi:hypothetical protein
LGKFLEVCYFLVILVASKKFEIRK